MRSFVRSALAGVLFFVSFGLAAQGKIDQSTKELSEKADPLPTRPSSEARPSLQDDDSDHPFLDLFLDITFALFKFGVIGDYNSEDHLYKSVSSYPFYREGIGNYRDSIEDNLGRLDISNRFLSDFRNIQANHLKVTGRPFQYIYARADWHQLREAFRNQPDDGLALFQLHVCYDRIRLPRFNMGWHLGVTYVGSGVNKAGVSAGVSAEVFLKKRWSFAGSATWSAVNESPVKVFELSSRYHLKNYFVSAGYEHLRIASPRYDFLGIGGGVYF
ncbi:MAG TPA: hypothetical protein VK183_03795 [Flavobacterium sp.]|nr:hypothetical protein [Flavobacterium sp.]